MKQARTSAGYEKMVLRMNEWLVEPDYDAFCDVVEVSEKRYRGELGRPIRPSWATERWVVLFQPRVCPCGDAQH